MLQPSTMVTRRFVPILAFDVVSIRPALDKALTSFEVPRKATNIGSSESRWDSRSRCPVFRSAWDRGIASSERRVGCGTKGTSSSASWAKAICPSGQCKSPKGVDVAFKHESWHLVTPHNSQNNSRSPHTTDRSNQANVMLNALNHRVHMAREHLLRKTQGIALGRVERHMRRQ